MMVSLIDLEFRLFNTADAYSVLFFISLVRAVVRLLENVNLSSVLVMKAPACPEAEGIGN